VAQWIYSLGGVNIHVFDDYAYNKAAENGHDDVVEWLDEINQ